MSDTAELTDLMLLSPDQLVAALAQHEQQAAALSLAVRRLETIGSYANDGSVSMAVWLRNHARMSNQTAHRLVARGRFLDRFAAVADAALSHRLSAGQVDALQGAYRKAHEPVLAEQQAELVEVLAPLTVSDTQAACAVWQQRADAVVADGKPPADPERSWAMVRGDDGALVGRFILSDAAATECETAIDNALTHNGTSESRSLAERQADAVHDIMAFYNKNHDSDGTPRHRPHVTISADAASLRSGTPVGVNTNTGRVVETGCVGTYLCDCKIHGILRDADGAPESFGRTSRTVPSVLFAQVAARDGGCRIPGCDRKVRHCDAHHLWHWEHGGPTDYQNLALLCSRHHHLVHREQWKLKLSTNGDLHVTLPDGTTIISQPRGRPPTLELT